MIRRATTFVIGAGASVPYGLSTGSGLLTKAVRSPLNSDVYKYVQTVLTQRRIHPPELSLFREAIARHPEDSIDAFLEKNKMEPTATIGKLVLAAFLGEEWNTPNLRKTRIGFFILLEQ